MPPVNEELIAEAIAAHRNDLSLRKASEAYGINRQTLANRIAGLQTLEQSHTPFQRLSPVQEDRLATWIIGQKALNYVSFHIHVRMIVSRLFTKQGDTSPVG